MRKYGKRRRLAIACFRSAFRESRLFADTKRKVDDQVKTAAAQKLKFFQDVFLPAHCPDARERDRD